MADETDDQQVVEEDQKPETAEETPEEPKETEEPEAPSTDEPTETPAEPEESAEESPPEEEETAEPKLSRKERRQRTQAFMESVRREQAQTPPTPPQEEYNPLDYSKMPEEGFEVDQLAKDREAYAKAEAQKAAQAERFRAEQEKFMDRLGHASEKLAANPKYSFLDQESEDFDEERTGTVNELFLATAGYDPQTKTFRDTSLDYEKFVKKFVDTVEDWTGDQTAETAKKMAAAKSRQGVRPTAAKKGPSIATPEDIAKLTPEQYKKLKPQIEAQANRLFEQAS